MAESPLQYPPPGGLSRNTLRASTHIGTIGFALGFVLMMVLDVVLG